MRRSGSPRTSSAADSIEEAVQDADFVEEAVPEILSLKHETLARVSAAARADALIGSNTSTISIGTLAEAGRRARAIPRGPLQQPGSVHPGRGGHPACEHESRRRGGSDRLLAESGKLGVEVADVTGFVLNRLQYALFSEAARLVEEGVASAEAVDTITRTTFGYRLPFFGPFAIADMAGLDVYAFCYRSLSEGYPERFTAPEALSERVADGALGVKSGRGFLATPPDQLPALVAHRDTAYAAMSKLLAAARRRTGHLLTVLVQRRLAFGRGDVVHDAELSTGSFRNPLDRSGRHPE